MPHAGYIFAGGGTGGHLFPGMAVAEELRRQDPLVAIEFWGTERELERRILQEHGWEHRSLPGEPSTEFRRHPVRVLRGNWNAYRQASRWLRERSPAVVIGLGGFSSVPVVLAARRLDIPVLLMEQNIVPGRGTHILCRWSRVVCTSFPTTIDELPRWCRVELTGNPISRELSELSVRLMNSTHVEENRRQILILGGSQGASAINQAIIDTLPKLESELRDWHIVHQTGEADADRVRAEYQRHRLDATVSAFLSPMSEYYSRAACVISRAGATTLAELACCGIPAILIPYPHAVNQHQLKNACYYRDRGAAEIVEQSRNPDDFASRLAERLRQLLADQQRRQSFRKRMRELAFPDAAQSVVRWIRELSGPTASVGSKRQERQVDVDQKVSSKE